jgi:hypothetical protein
MAEDGILSFTIRAQLDKTAKDFMSVLERGANIGGSSRPASGSSGGAVEVKGLLGKIVAGVAIGNTIHSAFYDFLKPIFNILKIILTVVFLPLIPIMSKIIEVFSVILPGLYSTSQSISDAITGILGGPPKDKSPIEAGAEVGAVGGALIGGAAGFVLGGPAGAVAGAAIGSNILKGVTEFVGGIVLWLKENFLKGLDIVTTAIGKVFFAIGSFLAGIWNKIAPILEGLYESFLGVVNSIWTTITDTAKGIFDKLLGFFTGIWDSLSATFDSIKTSVEGWLSTILDFFKKPVNALLDAIFGALNGIISALKAITIKIPAITVLGIGKVFDGITVSPFSFLNPLAIPQLATGGYITKSGIAEVHKGETVVPPGKGGVSYSPTYNLSGGMGDAMLKKLLMEHDQEFLSNLRRMTSTGGRLYNA